MKTLLTKARDGVVPRIAVPLLRRSSIKVPRLPCGTGDFEEMRRARSAIADKTWVLPEILDPAGDKITVVTRPPRFMKTNLCSMMDKFLSIQDADANRALFDGLAISDVAHAEFRAQYQGKVPVIFLTLKNIEADSWPEAKEDFSSMIANLYRKHLDVMPSLDEGEREQYQLIISNKAKDSHLKRSLADLSTYLYKHYKRKVIILIDEYDTPLYSAHLFTKKEERMQRDSYFHLMTNFLGSFFGQALKDHPHVEKGFMTGVLRTSFASLVSSLNNSKVYSVLSPKFAEVFGFTEAEVNYFISKIEGVEEKERDEIKMLLQHWYNGYRIGNSSVRMYNPWSVAQFFNDLPTSGNLAAQAHWLQIGNSIALSEYFNPRYKRLQPQLADLMLGKAVTVNVDDRTTLSNLDDPRDDSAFWGLLLHTGYLSVCSVRQAKDTIFTCDVLIPNHEVAGAYVRLIKNYQQYYLLADKDPFLGNYNAVLESLKIGDIDEFVRCLQIYMEQAISFHDIPRKAEKPKLGSGLDMKQSADKIREKIYHALILGLLLPGLHNQFQLSSNREAGYGRYDIVLTPNEADQHGLILEFKATDDPDKMLSEAENALQQIEEKRYSACLEARGVATGIHIGIGFCGKRFHVSHKKVAYSLSADQVFRPLPSSYSRPYLHQPSLDANKAGFFAPSVQSSSDKLDSSLPINNNDCSIYHK